MIIICSSTCCRSLHLQGFNDVGRRASKKSEVKDCQYALAFHATSVNTSEMRDLRREGGRIWLVHESESIQIGLKLTVVKTEEAMGRPHNA